MTEYIHEVTGVRVSVADGKRLGAGFRAVKPEPRRPGRPKKSEPKGE